MYWYLFDLSSVIYGALPQTPLKELLQKFLKNLQKLLNIYGFALDFYLSFGGCSDATAKFLHRAHHAPHAFTEELRPQPPFVACTTAVAGSNARLCGVLTARHYENFI
jgi:hypothetical protein